jgi:hypothetical protein
VNYYSIGRTSTLTVGVADNQKIAKASHAEFAIGNMEIGELLHRWIICVAQRLKSVAHENARALIEMFPIKQLGILFNEDVGETGHAVSKFGRQRLGFGESCVN